MRAIGIKRVVAFYLTMGAVAVAALVGRDAVGTLTPGLEVEAWLLHVGAGLGVGLMMVASSRVATSQFRWGSRLAKELASIIGELNSREALLLAAASAFAEEALFRGVLQPALGLWVGAAVFGVLHMGPNRNFLPWTAMAFVAGLLFGWLFQWSGNLAAPIVAHAVVNFLNLRHLGATKKGEPVHLNPVGGEGLAGL